jgi:hypothetical protein
LWASHLGSSFLPFSSTFLLLYTTSNKMK